MTKLEILDFIFNYDIRSLADHLENLPFEQSQKQVLIQKGELK